MQPGTSSRVHTLEYLWQWHLLSSEMQDSCWDMKTQRKSDKMHSSISSDFNLSLRKTLVVSLPHIFLLGERSSYPIWKLPLNLFCALWRGSEQMDMMVPYGLEIQESFPFGFSKFFLWPSFCCMDCSRLNWHLLKEKARAFCKRP